jgi:hypothetical protein
VSGIYRRDRRKPRQVNANIQGPYAGAHHETVGISGNRAKYLIAKGIPSGSYIRIRYSNMVNFRRRTSPPEPGSARIGVKVGVDDTYGFAVHLSGEACTGKIGIDRIEWNVIRSGQNYSMLLQKIEEPYSLVIMVPFPEESTKAPDSADVPRINQGRKHA